MYLIRDEWGDITEQLPAAWRNLCCRGLCRWHPFGSEAEDDGHNRVKHIRVQHGDQLLSVNLFSCSLYVGESKTLQFQGSKDGLSKRAEDDIAFS